jgi:serine/threonine-protein kinase HipA
LLASERVVDDTDTDDDLRLLLAPGSSLGGARPKATVRDRDGQLAIAKFPHKNDETDVELWEALALTLAGQAGIPVPGGRLEKISGKTVLLLRRFDRDGARRISFLSAMSMLGAHDNETRSYLEMADALRQYGSQPEADMHQLWRRLYSISSFRIPTIICAIMVSFTRVREAGGCRLRTISTRSLWT